MGSHNVRRDEDLAKLKALESRTGGRIQVTKVSGTPISTIGLRLLVRTSMDSRFPQKDIREVNATISLSGRYPFEPPVISLNTAVFNPNIYPSGKVCLGSKWLATEFLDLLAQRLFKILAFDDTIINVSSPANGEAAKWYSQARLRHPQDFPSDSLIAVPSQPSVGMKWVNQKAPEAPAEKIIVSCPKCQTKLRIQAKMSGTVSCPSCKNEFSVPGR